MLIKTALVLALLLAAPPSVAQAQPTSIDGLWRSPSAAEVEIFACGAKRCGRVVKQAAPEDGEPPSNPVGHMLLSDLQLDKNDLWRGTVFDTGYGGPLPAKVRLQRNGGLRVEGCLAGFCDGETWARAERAAP